MRVLRTASILVLSTFLLAGSSATLAASNEVPPSGIRQGDWAKYIGSPPCEEYEWIHLSFLQVKGYLVNISMRYYLRWQHRTTENYGYWPDHPRFVSIDVKNGIGSSFLFLTPPNLTVRDTVPAPVDYANLTIEGMETRKYAGTNRTVIYARYLNLVRPNADFNVEGIFYWDRETGLLVEHVVNVESFYVTSQELTETSLWSPDLINLVIDNSVVMVLLVSAGAASTSFTIFVFRTRRKISFKVTHPNLGKVFVALAFIPVAGVTTMSNYGQVVSSLSFGLVPLFFVAGILVYSGGWVCLKRDKPVVDLDIIMIASAVIMAGVMIGSATYRELGAIVPYLQDENFFSPYIRVKAKTYAVLDGVFFYPYSWLASTLGNIAFCLAAVGFCYKLSQKL
jgi:hypothetical protein